MLPLPFTFVESVWLPKNLPCLSSIAIDPFPRGPLNERDVCTQERKPIGQV